MLERHHDAVLEVLRSRPREELTARQIGDGLDQELPEHTVVLVLGELVHEGLVERRSEAQPGRRRAVSWYRVTTAT